MTYTEYTFTYHVSSETTFDYLLRCRYIQGNVSQRVDCSRYIATDIANHVRLHITGKNLEIETILENRTRNLVNNRFLFALFIEFSVNHVKRGNKKLMCVLLLITGQVFGISLKKTSYKKTKKNQQTLLGKHTHTSRRSR